MLLKEIQPKTGSKEWITQEAPSYGQEKGRDPSSQPSISISSFLFDQVHQRVAVQDPLGPVGPSHRSAGQKDHSFLPLSIVHDKGSRIACMIQPVPSRFHPEMRGVLPSHAQKFWDKSRANHPSDNVKKRSRSATVEKSSTSRMTAQYFRFGIMNTSRSNVPRTTVPPVRPVQTVSLSIFQGKNQLFK